MAPDPLNKTAAVILAAGSSRRMGKRGKKELLLLDDRPVIRCTVEKFTQSFHFQPLLIVCPHEGMEAIRESLRCWNHLQYCTGGKRRQDSVRLALEYLEKQDTPIERVLIHDGARPWVTEEVIRGVLRGLETADAVIPVEPSISAMKRVDPSGTVIQHLKRGETWVAQTPQGFRFSPLLTAHRRTAEIQEEFIDDSELWDRFCGPVRVSTGDPENRKITYSEDLR